MSKTQVELDVELAEVEPTFEEVEKQAARQLLNEMFMIKRRIYGIAMNGVLLLQVKQLVRGLMTKYREFGLFDGESIDVKFIPKQNTAEFYPSPKLKQLFSDVIAELPKFDKSEMGFNGKNRIINPDTEIQPQGNENVAV